MAMMALISKVSDDEYHGQKLRNLLRSIATEGRCVIKLSMLPLLILYSILSRRLGNPRAERFTVRLD